MLSPLSRTTRWLAPALTLLLAAVAAAWIIIGVDLSPRVESDFFFASDDPQLLASQRIAELFPSRPQLIVAVTAEDLYEPETQRRLTRLSDETAAVPGVVAVRSLTHGPASPRAAHDSPFWSRLLGGDRRSSLLIAELEPGAESQAVAAVERLAESHGSVGFQLRLSGVPYAVELIRRHLERDLRIFSLAAFAVFGLLLAAVYRSAGIVAAALATCTSACAVALAALALIGSPIGLLTANILTIVFVLTLSHVVFLTAAWRRERAATNAAGRGEPARDAVARAVKATFPPSFWCMVTTFLGFASLLLASAEPLRELGRAGALGAVAAIGVAYGLYPGLLRLLKSAPPAAERRWSRLPRPPAKAALLAAALAVAVAGGGLWRLDTDPSLLAYFDPRSDLRRGLESIDRGGGSSPLLLVVRDPGGGTLDGDEALDRLARAQASFDRDPAVGTALSLPLLVEEARGHPLAMFFSSQRLVGLLDSELFDRAARAFLTADRERALFYLRMREQGRTESRRAVIERLRKAVAEQGLEVELTGGLYELQAALGALVARSLAAGLAGLLGLFLVIAAILTRAPRAITAMLAALATVPILVLGAIGWAGGTVDVISSPAANVSIALGIDAMIHLAAFAGRRRRAGMASAEAWLAARDELWPAIAGAVVILAAGFGIFGLSSFPPTRRFGLATAGGTLAAGALALWVLPRLVGGPPPTHLAKRRPAHA